MLAPNRPRAELIPVADAAEIRGDWIDLAGRAREPNPYYEPDHLDAICRFMRPREDHGLVVVREQGARRLSGLFPVTVMGLLQGYPGGVTRLSFDSLIGQTVPLVAGEDPAAVWTAFLEFVAERSDMPSVVHLPEFYPDSACGRALAEVAGRGRAVYRVERGFDRAVAANGLSYDDYVARWSRKKARNVRSRFRKLSELGTVELSVVEPSHSDFEETLRAILELEKAGWKGRAGTALASTDHTRSFAHAAYLAGRGAPLVHLAVLRLDGRLIAGDINLISGRRAYFIKSAYDEDYAQYGPGVILYGFALEEMLERGRYERLDSCADAGHPLEEIWLERERVESAFVAAAGSANARAIDRIMARRAGLNRVRGAVRGVARRLRRGA